mmetsp:Transcript_1482/g.5744  ORF Transcript_1482/g.5744 Transcript_1482/m.5744 type:complete len:238 (+) Transcript_1482:594-1307(+)
MLLLRPPVVEASSSAVSVVLSDDFLAPWADAAPAAVPPEDPYKASKLEAEPHEPPARSRAMGVRPENEEPPTQRRRDDSAPTQQSARTARREARSSGPATRALSASSRRRRASASATASSWTMCATTVLYTSSEMGRVNVCRVPWSSSSTSRSSRCRSINALVGPSSGVGPKHPSMHVRMSAIHCSSATASVAQRYISPWRFATTKTRSASPNRSRSTVVNLSNTTMPSASSESCRL